jgi:hypothetical protein
MTQLIARTFRGRPDGWVLPGWRPPAEGGPIWVGIFDEAGTELAATKADTDFLSGDPFVAALVAAAESLGYTATSGIRATADDECEFDVEPAGARSDG